MSKSVNPIEFVVRYVFLEEVAIISVLSASTSSEISEILYPGDDNCCRCMRVEGKSCDRGWGDCDFDWECSGVRL